MTGSGIAASQKKKKETEKKGSQAGAFDLWDPKVDLWIFAQERTDGGKEEMSNTTTKNLKI